MALNFKLLRLEGFRQPGAAHCHGNRPPPRPRRCCAPNKVVVEAPPDHVSRPGGGAGGGASRGGAEPREIRGLQRRGRWTQARRPAMIASCLCYLLLPAARLFRALAGTGPASFQAGARPGPAPRG